MTNLFIYLFIRINALNNVMSLLSIKFEKKRPVSLSAENNQDTKHNFQR